MGWYCIKSALWCSRVLREAQSLESETAVEGTLHLRKESCLGVIKMTGLVCSSGLEVKCPEKWIYQAQNEILREIQRSTMNSTKPLTRLLCMTIYLLSSSIFITTDLYTCEACEVEMSNLGKWQGARAANSRVQMLGNKNFNTEE